MKINRKPTDLKTLRTAAWLGWMIESNWTDPFVFAIYAIIVPISQAAILIVMYLVIRGGDFSSADFVNMYIGNAFYLMVGATLQGVSFGILDDREHYRTLKYIYIAPLKVPVYLLGRSVASMLVSSLSVLITLIFGVVFLHLPLSLAAVNWRLLAATLALGLVTLVSLGIILGGWILLIRNNAWQLGGAVGLGLFIFSGAVFPITLLPGVLQVVGYSLPIGYWLTLIRRAVVPAAGQVYPMFTNLSNEQLLLILVGFGVVYMVAAWLLFKRFDKTARENGMIDMVSNY